MSIIKTRSQLIAVFSRMRGNKFSERLAVQDSNTPHLCDYRYNLLTKENTLKLGIKNKRLRAGWDEDYLFQVLLA